MKERRKFEIKRPQPGVLSHREAGTEFTFPVYDHNGEVVVVTWPSTKRVLLYFLFGGWQSVPNGFSKRDRERINGDIKEHFGAEGIRVRFIDPTAADERRLAFHPELFECKSRASAILDTVGFTWLSDYSSIDILHEEFGLEVCGVREESNLETMAHAMRAEFPHWHYSQVYHKPAGRDSGWTLAVYMLPRPCQGGQCEE